MSQLTFLLDENVSHKTLGRLRRSGFNVESVKTQSKLGTSNGDLIDLINKRNWVLITHDSDFLTPIFKAVNGVIVVKIHPVTDEISGKILENFLSSVDHELLKGKKTVLERDGWYFLKE
ncbi:MAG: DUF5615 family PIN-like protein [Candidatus Hodarchaeales archaeon]